MALQDARVNMVSHCVLTQLFYRCGKQMLVYLSSSLEGACIHFHAGFGTEYVDMLL